jgi:hypothetical protein
MVEFRAEPDPVPLLYAEDMKKVTTERICVTIQRPG